MIVKWWYHSIQLWEYGNNNSAPRNMMARLLFHNQISDVQSPPGYLSSWARAGPSGSAPKSTRKFSLSFRPPFFVSTSICIITDPSLKWNKSIINKSEVILKLFKQPLQVYNAWPELKVYISQLILWKKRIKSITESKNWKGNHNSLLITILRNKVRIYLAIQIFSPTKLNFRIQNFNWIIKSEM